MKKYTTVDSNPIGHLVNIYTIRKSAKPICTLYISVVVWHYIESDLVTYPVLSFILFQICRDECEVLEYQLCQKELAIARSQPMISHQLVLPDCKELPVIGWVAKSRSYFFQILHISPILDKITTFPSLLRQILFASRTKSNLKHFDTEWWW